MRAALRTALVLVGIAACFLGLCEGRRPLSNEERLLQFLFADYNPAARPVINSSHTADVRIQFSLLQIQDLNLRNQILSTTGLLILEWRDERLTWDPQDFEDLKEIVVEAKYLWRPEFASINGADGIYGEYGEFRAIILSSGHVHWEPGGVFKTKCEIDITYYPFDMQRCQLVFGSWGYHVAKMNMTNTNVTINMDSYEENGEWSIERTRVERHEFFFDSCPAERFANVAFSIFMRRRYTFYIMNVILPSLMTSVLLLSIFFCTPAQKVQIGVVVLLSFRIFLLNVTDSIPKTSDHIPVLGIYLTCTTAITTLSMVLTVLVLNLHYKADRPVPRWTKQLVLVYIARLLCMRQYRLYSRRDHPGGDETDPHGRLPNGLGRAINAPLNLMVSLNGSMVKTSRASNPPRDDGPKYRPEYYPAGTFVNKEEPDAIDQSKQEEAWARDWRRLAEVVDRMLFWLFFSATSITTLILFHPLTKSYFSILGDETIQRKSNRSDR